MKQRRYWQPSIQYLSWNLLLFLLLLATVASAWIPTSTIHHAGTQIDKRAVLDSRTTSHRYLLKAKKATSDDDDSHPSNNDPRRLLIVGYGRVGQQVAKLAAAHQTMAGCLYWTEIVGTVRDGNENNNALAVRNDDDDASCKISLLPISKLKEALPHYSHVLIAMPPVEEIYQTVLDLATNCHWLGMVSTTGVYGNHDGAWVTEESELRCNDNGSASLYVEWERALASCKKVRIFRCAGIYDSTRSALHTLWKQRNGEQKATTMKEEFKTNRIHATDIAQAIVNSMIDDDDDLSSKLQVYNLSDDMPERRSTVMEYASKLFTKRLGKDWRRITVIEDGNVDDKKSSDSETKETATTTTTTTTTRETKSTRRRRREQEPKLIDNQKLKKTLLPKLLYPSYKEGLDAILVDPQAPWNNLPGGK